MRFIKTLLLVFLAFLFVSCGVSSKVEQSDADVLGYYNGYGFYRFELRVWLEIDDAYGAKMIKIKSPRIQVDGKLYDGFILRGASAYIDENEEESIEHRFSFKVPVREPFEEAKYIKIYYNTSLNGRLRTQGGISYILEPYE